jgi:NNP family nitrate/nitrite transporter-like MFS transporter
LTHRLTISVSVLTASASLVALSFVHSVTIFHVLVFVGGLGNGMYPGSGIAAVTMLVPDAHRGKALAVHECGPNLSFILAPIIAAALAPSFGWRSVTLVVGIGGIVVTLLFTLFGRASRDRGQPPSFANIAGLMRNTSFWVLSVLFVVAFTAAAGVYSVLPTYLIVDHGLSERFVNNLVGASRVTGFLAILSAGTLTDRFGFRPVVTIILLVTGTVTILLGVAHGWFLVVSVFLQPLVVGAFFPVGLNALSRVTSPERRNLAIALAIPLANIMGVGTIPPLLTTAGARGFFSVSFVVLGAIVLASIGLLPIMKRGERTAAGNSGS